MRSVAVIVVLLGLASAVSGQILSYPNPYLDYVYPAGARQGQTVSVEFGAVSGLDGAKAILIDGPPGISVVDVKPVNGALVKATLKIAADAVPGRRYLRVLGGSNGLTNFRYFFVGNLPEVLDTGANDTPAAAQDVATPVIVNGRIDKDLDVDCYRFSARAGQRCVIAVLAHGMDSVQRATFVQGYVDTSLELLDAQGKVLAAADDTIGLDPALAYTFAADGKYTVRLQSLSYKGSLSSVYRLTIGDVPYPTAVFPAGSAVDRDVEITGLNIDKAMRRRVALFGGGKGPVRQTGPTYVALEGGWRGQVLLVSLGRDVILLHPPASAEYN